MSGPVYQFISSSLSSTALFTGANPIIFDSISGVYAVYTFYIRPSLQDILIWILFFIAFSYVMYLLGKLHGDS